VDIDDKVFACYNSSKASNFIITCRPRTPEQDAEIVLSIRAAVGTSVELRADANRGWSLQEAVRFGQALHGSQGSSEQEVTWMHSRLAGDRPSKGVPLAYIEEPTMAATDWLAFYEQTGKDQGGSRRIKEDTFTL
jgi:hypothetical protein